MGLDGGTIPTRSDILRRQSWKLVQRFVLTLLMELTVAEIEVNLHVVVLWTPDQMQKKYPWLKEWNL